MTPPDLSEQSNALIGWLSQYGIALAVLAVTLFLVYRWARPLIHRVLVDAVHRQAEPLGDDQARRIEIEKRITTLEDLLAKILRSFVVLAIVVVIFAAFDLWPILEKPRPGVHVYCCGPGTLMDAVRDMTGHWSSSAIHFEDFAVREVPHRAGDKPVRVRIGRAGPVVDVPENLSILEALRANGYRIASSCESGTCGTCRTTSPFTSMTTSPRARSTAIWVPTGVGMSISSSIPSREMSRVRNTRPRSATMLRLSTRGKRRLSFAMGRTSAAGGPPHDTAPVRGAGTSARFPGRGPGRRM